MSSGRTEGKWCQTELCKFRKERNENPKKIGTILKATVFSLDVFPLDVNDFKLKQTVTFMVLMKYVYAYMSISVNTEQGAGWHIILVL